MRAADEVPGLAKILASEAFDTARGEQYVQWAQNALAAGLETPSVLRLAIEEPPFFTPDLQKLFRLALSELKVEPITDEEAMVLYAQQVARPILSGAMTPRDGARLFATLFPPHRTPAALGEWWKLDEAYDCDYCRTGVLQNYRSIEEAILAEARSLIAASWRRRRD